MIQKDFHPYSRGSFNYYIRTEEGKWGLGKSEERQTGVGGVVM